MRAGCSTPYENLASRAPGRRACWASPELEATLGEMLRRGDKGGDVFYDTISALHKSVRGSDPDAALYWLARLLDAGMDPRYAARRLVRMASEDIGLADPRALRLALDAAEVYERLGSPEGELALAEAAVYLAVAPKSNAVYKAWNEVRELVRRDGTRPVPPHLRNAPTRLMKDLGHGAGYRYAHDEPGGYAAGEHYLPDGLPAQRWYEPVPRGLELRIGQRLAELRALDERGDEVALRGRRDAPAPVPCQGVTPARCSGRPPPTMRPHCRLRRAGPACTASFLHGLGRAAARGLTGASLDGNLLPADPQRSGARQHVRAGGAGLHDGLRHHQPHQLRARRSADGGCADELDGGHARWPIRACRAGC